MPLHNHADGDAIKATLEQWIERQTVPAAVG